MTIGAHWFPTGRSYYIPSDRSPLTWSSKVTKTTSIPLVEEACPPPPPPPLPSDSSARWAFDSVASSLSRTSVDRRCTRSAVSGREGTGLSGMGWDVWDGSREETISRVGEGRGQTKAGWRCVWGHAYVIVLGACICYCKTPLIRWDDDGLTRSRIVVAQSRAFHQELLLLL